MAPVKKRFSVVYRRSTHDKRAYGTNPWKRHFLEIIVDLRPPSPKSDIFARVKKIGRRFVYKPSKEYFAFLDTMKERERKLVLASESRQQQHLLTENTLICTSQQRPSGPSVAGPIRKGKR